MVGRGVFAAVALMLAATVTTMSASGVAHAGVGPDVPGPLVVVPAAPAPQPVPTACAWIVRDYASNCDGLDPDRLYVDAAWPTACTGNDDVLTHTIASTTLSDGSVIQLTYSGGTAAGCRTVAASLYVPDYHGSAPCTLTITRTADNASITAKIVYYGGFWSAETGSLYDAGVSSYASASCTYGGHTYAGRTSAY
ncbi:MAG TPA: hypothetical protein VGF84_18215 [Micromonosporaceae bacterium]